MVKALQKEQLRYHPPNVILQFTLVGFRHQVNLLWLYSSIELTLTLKGKNLGRPYHNAHEEASLVSSKAT